ncbi:hypothetical protein J5U23_01376 [Saccharolobus shibatae B12]|uniref:Uncharacterized protein n=1 Tax=Saccharolobus shibatae (strain ATCC 51178 / DSM 5389 / JCM 8931 / NBRC 15437 / B12) TaxID=523848 RepID=A0A8F5BNG2_SACSH|nr:hypothetical protein J5U23_01376 [Saccharolobus shibatae B12]
MVVRWFLGEWKSKSEIHRRAKKFGEKSVQFSRSSPRSWSGS